MTKSTITDERITSVIERLEHYACNLKWTDVRGAQDLLTAADGLRELQERRKADSEPVAGEARFKEERPRWTPCTAEHVSMVMANPEDWPNYEVRYLYAAPQPAPVVPDAATAIRACLSEFPESARDIVEECADIAENACRAAMLQAEPVTTANKLGNSPVIPDGWKLVPVEPNGDMLAAAQDAYGETDGDIASTLRAAMLAAAQPAPTIQVTDAMAYAFHHALTDGPLDDEDVEDIKAGLQAAFSNVTATQPALVVQDGYVMVPMRLTAENGAKGALSGEFSETKFVNCPECFGDDECETCDGSGRIEITVPVTWTTIKEIWAKGVEHFAAASTEE